MSNYILVSVLTHADGSDCSKNGVTVSHTDKLVVEHPRGNITAEDVEARGYVILKIIQRNIGANVYLHAEPEHLIDNTMTMAGGNYITGDSRFREISQYPLSVHDRVE